MNSGKNKNSVHLISGPILLSPGSWVVVTSASHTLPTHCVISGRNPPTSRQHQSTPKLCFHEPSGTELFSSSPHPVNSNALLQQHFTVWSFPTATSQNRQLWVCPSWPVPDTDRIYQWIPAIEDGLSLTCSSRQLGTLVLPWITFLFPIGNTLYHACFNSNRTVSESSLQQFWTWRIRLLIDPFFS